MNLPVRYFKGVGPKKSECLSRLGIETSRDLLYYLPARYEDRSKFIPVRQLRRGEYQTVRGELQSVGSRRAKTGTPVFEATVKDLSGTIRAVWFNQPYLRDILKKGQKVVLYGKVELFDKLQIIQPEYEILETEEVDSIHMGRIVPVYSLTESVTQKYLRSLIHQTITVNNKNIIESLPTYLIAREKLVDLRFAMHNIHFPASFENLEKAYKRIVFEEFFMLQLALALKSRDARQKESGIMVDAKGEIVDAFKKALPF
ncbi:MAG: OB-fold nucleic acid binding domain-containing protein, partial [Candidatus Omnitrophota bacterium]